MKRPNPVQCGTSSGAEFGIIASIQVDLSGTLQPLSRQITQLQVQRAGGTDYTLADGTITIAANTTSDNITIASIVDDSLYEGDETVIVTLSSVRGNAWGDDCSQLYYCRK